MHRATVVLKESGLLTHYHADAVPGAEGLAARREGDAIDAPEVGEAPDRHRHQVALEMRLVDGAEGDAHGAVGAEVEREHLVVELVG